MLYALLAPFVPSFACGGRIVSRCISGVCGTFLKALPNKFALMDDLCLLRAARYDSSSRAVVRGVVSD